MEVPLPYNIFSESVTNWQTDTYRDAHTNGTDSITSTADMEGNKSGSCQRDCKRKHIRPGP